MLGVFSAGTTVFGESKFLWSVCLVSFGDVVEMTTFSAFQTDMLSGSFFSHNEYVFGLTGIFYIQTAKIARLGCGQNKTPGGISVGGGSACYSFLAAATAARSACLAASASGNVVKYTSSVLPIA